MNKKKSAPRNSNPPLRAGNRPVKGSNADEEGIYVNKRFTLACTALVGAPVTIETVDGKIYEGIFRIFSPQLELTLDVAHLVDAKDPGKICEDNVKSMVFNMKDVIRCSAIDTDLDYATKDGFLTDTQISGSKVNGEVPMKQLEQWQPDGIEESELHDLNSGDANGWTAEDMFARNERDFGVQTTFKSNLEGYTIQLNTDRNSEEFREREALAAELAREIEGGNNQSSRTDVELEDDNEEEAFSAVVRPSRGGGDRNSTEQDHESSKYIPPARRQNSNSQPHGGMGRDNRNTGPRHQQQPSPHGHDGRQSMHQQQPHHQQRRDYAPASVSPHQLSSSHSGRDHHVHHHDDYGRSGGGGGSGGPSNRRTSYGRSEHDGGHQHQSHHQQQKPMPGGRGGQTGPGQSRNRGDQISELKDFGNKFNLASSPVVSVQQDQTSPKLGPQFHAQQPQQLPVRSPVMSERKGGSPTLTVADQRHSVSPPQQHHQSLQQHPPTQPVQPSVASPNAIQRQKSETETAQATATILTQPVAPPEASSPTLASASTPPAAGQTSSSTGASNVKKSTLNPNAKEFVLNPNAKVFVPGASSNAGQVVTMSQGRPPISATPPRPMTPATPTIPIAYAPHLMAQVGPAGVQPQHQYYHIVPTSMANQMYNPGPQVAPYGAFQPNPAAIQMSQTSLPQPPQPQQQQQQRFRVNPNANPVPRPVNPVEVQSPNHVLASTGQPILAQMPTASPSQPPSYVQFPPQAAQHQFAAANMAAMMQQQANLMRFPPGSMAHMMVTQSPNTMPITTMSGILDPSGQHIAWMQSQQGQAPPPHMPGVPPPNPMAGPHLGQPPPQAGQQQPPHTPQSIASPAQVAAVQAAVAQQQQQQQQMTNNGGGHTPAPSPGPMGMYNSGPQSLPPTFTAAYPGNVFMMPHGGAGPHAVLQQQIISSQGQPLPPPQMHQFALQHGIPGQQSAPHSMLYPMTAQHAANMAAAAQVQGPQGGGPAPQ